MSFKNRNLYYLRVTHNTILPLYVYLDEQHTSWMSDFILQRLLLDLRPHVLSKLGLDTVKMSKVNTVQGDEYQFCYFFRDIGNQSVLVKRRFYTAEAVSTKQTQSGKRKARSKDTADSNGPKKSKRKRRETQSQTVDQSVVGVSRSQREEDDNGAIGSASLADIADDTMSETPVVNEDDLMDTDIAEEKPKPRMQLKYEGFHINGQCLCVVVEPLPTGGKESSLTTVPYERPESSPELLFLPDQETDLTDDPSPDTERGMMTLSQRLHAISADYTTTLLDDGEDSEGEIFLGDADDARGY